MYEVGIMTDEFEWVELIFKCKTYEEALAFCKQDRSNKRLWLHDTNNCMCLFDDEFYFNGKDIII